MESECLICYEKETVSYSSLPDPPCRHWTMTCPGCRNRLVKYQCPLCQHDWSEALGKKALCPFGCAILFSIVLFDDDVKLLNYLIEKRGFDPFRVYPVQEACHILTACAEVGEAAEIWRSYKDQGEKKKMVLRTQNIEWNEVTEKYQTLHR